MDSIHEVSARGYVELGSQLTPQLEFDTQYPDQFLQSDFNILANLSCALEMLGRLPIPRVNSDSNSDLLILEGEQKQEVHIDESIENRRSDKNIATVLQPAERSVIHELWENNSLSIYRHIKMLCFDPDIADDILSQTFLKVTYFLARGHSLPTDAHERKNYVFEIATNTFLDFLRHKNHKNADCYSIEKMNEINNNRFFGPDTTLPIDSGLDVGAALQQLPVAQRNLLILFCIYGYNYEEISKITRVTYRAIKQHVYRARLLLSKIYEASDTDYAQ